MLIRFLLLLGIAAGLILFALSNWANPLPLVFLGRTTPALPLAVWVLSAIAAGIVTHVVISTLFRLAGFAAAREVRAQLRRSARRGGFQTGATSNVSSGTTAGRAAATAAASRTKDEDADWKDWRGFEEPVSRKPAPSTDPKPEPVDDWDQPPSDDWDGEASTDSRQSPPDDLPPRTTPSDAAPSDSRSGYDERSNYEAPQQPRTASRSGSVYSYGYRDSDEERTSKRKMVVDANYRVIVPPYSSPEPPPPPPPPPVEPEENADDWFEDSNDDRDDRRPR